MGTPQKKYILETDGSGVGLIDYDNDGWLDIYLVNGSTYDALSGKRPRRMPRSSTTTTTARLPTWPRKAGVTNDRWGFGVAIGDFDNDGWPDIFVANFGKNRLYHNNHNGTFTDVARKAGVTLGNWSDGATWGDYDGDGRLDLFVSGYVHYDLNHQPTAKTARPSRFCQLHGAPVMCGPHGLQGEPDHPFHNNGDGTFTDVSVKAGVSDPALTTDSLRSLWM
jgi:enediyne biosynthesis protein E4